VRRRIAVEEEEQRRIWISDKLWREREREAAVAAARDSLKDLMRRTRKDNKQKR
jgi:diketogulonate reductase-like aldo/keto reductase